MSPSQGEIVKSSFEARASTRISVLSLVLALAGTGLFAQAKAGQTDLSLARDELSSAQGANIVFIDYVGPEARIESLAEIRGIGVSLGRGMTAGAPRSGDARYSVIRAVDPSVKEGFDADILVLGPGAQVDKISNLRAIIGGYLVTAWGYESKDAATLATFITIYNAVHRGDMAYIGSRYKAVVQRELTPENAGLSTRFDEWPGKSRILIPLSRGAEPGKLGAVDTGAVSDKAVVGSLKAEPGAGLGDRQDMTELKDREVDQRKADLAAKQAEIAQAEADLAKQKAAIADEKAAIAADKGVAAETGAAKGGEGQAAGTAAGKGAEAGTGAAAADKAGTDKTGATGSTGAAGEAGSGQQASIESREAAVKAEESKAAAQETAIAQKKEEAAADQQAIAAKEAEVAQDRAGIASDQKTAIAAEVAAKDEAASGGIYLFELLGSDSPYARLVRLDEKTGKLLSASKLNSIHSRAVVDEGASYVLVAGREGGNAAVRLTRVDKASLAASAEGKSDLFVDTALWKLGDSLYAVGKGSGGDWRLLRFDSKLALAATSALAVNPYSLLVESAGGLIVQTAGGGFAVLSPDRLEKVKDLKP
jgi:hypothetical protein